MISAPETYGFSPEETLAHTAGQDRPAGFDAYWAEFREAVASHKPHLCGTINDEANPVWFESLRNVRISGRLTMPEARPSGAVVALHGYETPDEIPGDDEPWTPLGLATLRLRVRGFPPSVEDTGDLRGGWILHRIESPESWIVRGAVADVVQACRCLRRRLGGDVPVMIHGESLGGGLAVIAAAQLAHLGEPPSRLVIGLPSLGDWRWRFGRYCNGAGALVNRMLDTFRDEADAVLERLRLLDAAIHAPDADSPVLCKLAMQDDVVPAPTAAAVYNALGSEKKWRFVTRYGHYDGGIANARRHALFERLHPAFLNPAREPGEVMAEWLDRLETVPASPLQL